jgi:DNA-binding MarR family transcriptional regulator
MMIPNRARIAALEVLSEHGTIFEKDYISRVVAKKLEQAGFAKRTPPSRVGRLGTVTVTDEGRAYLAALIGTREGDLYGAGKGCWCPACEKRLSKYRLVTSEAPKAMPFSLKELEDANADAPISAKDMVAIRALAQHEAYTIEGGPNGQTTFKRVQ